ncbi:GH16 beta-1 3-glucan recognition protein [Favolaschia claudopus]|uniref:GH16 beta-1 3-glucan recognition protein n=1 Tax=Favolaschia claudopus TaxID=2862362 RepID=A0AAW0AXL9_9AGAR
MARPAPLSFGNSTPFEPDNATHHSADSDFLDEGHTASSSDSPIVHPNASSSPPITPRSLSFLTPHPPLPLPAAAATNPFSPPASVRSFSAASFGGGGADTPYAHAHSGGGGAGGYPFPNLSPGSTRASSLVDVPRAFSGGSRPNTGVEGSPFANPPGSLPLPTSSSNGGGTPKREAFASPPSRPLTLYTHASSTPGSPVNASFLHPTHPNNSHNGNGLTATGMLRRKSTAILVPSRSVPDPDAELDKKDKKSKHPNRPTLLVELDKAWLSCSSSNSSASNLNEKSSGNARAKAKGGKDKSAWLAYLITYGTILIGLVAGGFRAWSGWRGVNLLTAPLCPVLLEDFTTTTTAQLFGSGVAGEGGTFFREVDASGFGNGEFEMTTASDTNSFVHNGQLYILPTLTSDVIPMGSILDNSIYNLTGCTYNITHSTGYTTSGHGAAGINTTEGEAGAPDAPLDLPAYLAACSAVSNATEGKILPPVMSARVSTRKSASLRFGRVEVVAKLPTGDWLWPAIWMLPVGNVYGGWPLSGEIDIMEARGNGPSYPKQGVNYVRSSLNWGPATFLNAVAKTYGWWTQRRGRYDEGFHTYALEWSEGFMRMYVDSRLTHMYEIKLSKSFWDFGDFPPVVQNGTESVVLQNPWVNGTKAAPFDQPFYLIMNVAVGGTNGWFPDGPEKPWLDGSATAPLDFLRAQSQWYSTWPQDPFKRAMVIDSVKMWEQCSG